MSISVHVHGDPISINRGGTILLTDVEALKREEFERRKKMRLEQVRQQSNDFSNKLLHKVITEKEKQQEYEKREKEAELRRWQVDRIKSLEKQYQDCLDSVKRTQQEKPQVSEEELRKQKLLQEKENIRKAKERGRAAMEKVQREKLTEEKKKENVEKQKDFCNTIEKLRSTLITSRQALKDITVNASESIENGAKTEESRRTSRQTDFSQHSTIRPYHRKEYEDRVSETFTRTDKTESRHVEEHFRSSSAETYQNQQRENVESSSLQSNVAREAEATSQSGRNTDLTASLEEERRKLLEYKLKLENEERKRQLLEEKLKMEQQTRLNEKLQEENKRLRREKQEQEEKERKQSDMLRAQNSVKDKSEQEKKLEEYRRELEKANRRGGDLMDVNIITSSRRSKSCSRVPEEPCDGHPDSGESFISDQTWPPSQTYPKNEAFTKRKKKCEKCISKKGIPPRCSSKINLKATADRHLRAYEKERLNQNFKNLLSELEHLSREERRIKSRGGCLFHDDAQLHMSEQRQKEKEKMKQNKMSSVFEQLCSNSNGIVPPQPANITQLPDPNSDNVTKLKNLLDRVNKKREMIRNELGIPNNHNTLLNHFQQTGDEQINRENIEHVGRDDHLINDEHDNGQMEDRRNLRSNVGTSSRTNNVKILAGQSVMMVSKEIQADIVNVNRTADEKVSSFSSPPTKDVPNLSKGSNTGSLKQKRATVPRWTSVQTNFGQDGDIVENAQKDQQTSPMHSLHASSNVVMVSQEVQTSIDFAQNRSKNVKQTEAFEEMVMDEFNENENTRTDVHTRKLCRQVKNMTIRAATSPRMTGSNVDSVYQVETTSSTTEIEISSIQRTPVKRSKKKKYGKKTTGLRFPPSPIEKVQQVRKTLLNDNIEVIVNIKDTILAQKCYEKKEHICYKCNCERVQLSEQCIGRKYCTCVGENTIETESSYMSLPKSFRTMHEKKMKELIKSARREQTLEHEQRDAQHELCNEMFKEKEKAGTDGTQKKSGHAQGVNQAYLKSGRRDVYEKDVREKPALKKYEDEVNEQIAIGSEARHESQRLQINQSPEPPGGPLFEYIVKLLSMDKAEVQKIPIEVSDVSIATELFTSTSDQSDVSQLGGMYKSYAIGTKLNDRADTERRTQNHTDLRFDTGHGIQEHMFTQNKDKTGRIKTSRISENVQRQCVAPKPNVNERIRKVHLGPHEGQYKYKTNVTDSFQLNKESTGTFGAKVDFLNARNKPIKYSNRENHQPKYVSPSKYYPKYTIDQFKPIGLIQKRKLPYKELFRQNEPELKMQSKLEAIAPILKCNDYGFGHVHPKYVSDNCSKYQTNLNLNKQHGPRLEDITLERVRNVKKPYVPESNEHIHKFVKQTDQIYTQKYDQRMEYKNLPHNQQAGLNRIDQKYIRKDGLTGNSDNHQTNQGFTHKDDLTGNNYNQRTNQSYTRKDVLIEKDDNQQTDQRFVRKNFLIQSSESGEESTVYLNIPRRFDNMNDVHIVEPLNETIPERHRKEQAKEKLLAEKLLKDLCNNLKENVKLAEPIRQSSKEKSRLHEDKENDGRAIKNVCEEEMQKEEIDIDLKVPDLCLSQHNSGRKSQSDLEHEKVLPNSDLSHMDSLVQELINRGIIDKPFPWLSASDNPDESGALDDTNLTQALKRLLEDHSVLKSNPIDNTVVTSSPQKQQPHTHAPSHNQTNSSFNENTSHTLEPNLKIETLDKLINTIDLNKTIESRLSNPVNDEPPREADQNQTRETNETDRSMMKRKEDLQKIFADYKKEIKNLLTLNTSSSSSSPAAILTSCKPNSIENINLTEITDLTSLKSNDQINLESDLIDTLQETVESEKGEREMVFLDENANDKERNDSVVETKNKTKDFNKDEFDAGSIVHRGTMRNTNTNQQNISDIIDNENFDNLCKKVSEVYRNTKSINQAWNDLLTDTTTTSSGDDFLERTLNCMSAEHGGQMNWMKTTIKRMKETKHLDASSTTSPEEKVKFKRKRKKLQCKDGHKAIDQSGERVKNSGELYQTNNCSKENSLDNFKEKIESLTKTNDETIANDFEDEPNQSDVVTQKTNSDIVLDNLAKCQQQFRQKVKTPMPPDDEFQSLKDTSTTMDDSYEDDNGSNIVAVDASVAQCSLNYQNFLKERSKLVAESSSSAREQFDLRKDTQEKRHSTLTANHSEHHTPEDPRSPSFPGGASPSKKKYSHSTPLKNKPTRHDPAQTPLCVCIPCTVCTPCSHQGFHNFQIRNVTLCPCEPCHVCTLCRHDEHVSSLQLSSIRLEQKDGGVDKTRH